MKKAISKHRTLSSGVVIAVIGAAQVGLPSIKDYLGERAFGLATFALGLLVAGIGAWNTLKAKRDAEDAAAGDPTDEAGA